MATTQSYTLITGASGGIGYELADIFAREKHNVILVARSEGKLQELKKKLESSYDIQAQVLVADLSKSDAVRRLYETTESRGWNVDILVNNAGFGALGEFALSDWSRQAEMIQVNITALTELTRLYLPHMLARKSGKIMNVASTAAFQAGPLMSVYYATKAYVLSFSEGLSEELQGTGVSVTALCPGPTESGFAQTAKMTDIPLLQTIKLPSSRDVAEYGYQAMMSEKVIAVHGFTNKIGVISGKFAPRAMTRKLVKKLQEKRTN
jgi:short-subunit dehydrogenase